MLLLLCGEKFSNKEYTFKTRFYFQIKSSYKKNEKNISYCTNAICKILKVSYICDVLRDLLPFLRFKKREKHSRGVKLQALLKVRLLHGCFSRFLNCKNGIKLRNTSHEQGWRIVAEINYLLSGFK